MMACARAARRSNGPIRAHGFFLCPRDFTLTPEPAIPCAAPLVATLGLSMMIPLSVFADHIRGLAHLSPQFFVGTFLVFVSYLLESWAEAPDSEEEAEEEAREEEDEGRRRDSISIDAPMCGIMAADEAVDEPEAIG